jgi:hypothetical protein
LSDARICMECKHFGGGPGAEPYSPHADPHGFVREVNKGPECKHPDAGTRDPVFGKAFCINERNATSKKSCGKQGKLWEPKSAG